jgi:hypothetical protein
VGELVDPLDRGEPVDPGHAQVHQHDIRPVAPDRLDRRRAILGLADDFQVVGGAEDRPQVRAHHRLVVDDHHPDGHGQGRAAGADAAAVGT